MFGMVIYVDGASIPNPGETGFGIVIPNIGEIARYCGQGSNNTAELMAVREALRLARVGDEIFTDSKYAIEIVSGRWKARENIDLVNEVRRLAIPQIQLKWIKGHAGDTWQQLADKLAKRAAKTKKNSDLRYCRADVVDAFAGGLSDGNFAQTR